jgi:transposase
MQNNHSQSPAKYYSVNLRKKIVQEIETGNLTKEQAKIKYGIEKKSLITRWCKKFGKGESFMKVHSQQRAIESLERDKIVSATEMIHQEIELNQALIKIECLEALIELTEKIYRVDLKKNSGGGSSR